MGQTQFRPMTTSFNAGTSGMTGYQ